MCLFFICSKEAKKQYVDECVYGSLIIILVM